jgi:hypothetical protein
LMPPHSLKPLKYPLNYEVANRAEGLIVHSEWSRERLKAIAPVTPIRRVPMYVSPSPAAVPPATSRNFGIDSIFDTDSLERSIRISTYDRSSALLVYRIASRSPVSFRWRSLFRKLPKPTSRSTFASKPLARPPPACVVS